MANEKNIYHFMAKVEDVEIRRVEDVDASFTGRDGKQVESHYIKLICDEGEDCNRVIFKDRDMSHLTKYKRGQVGTMYLRIDVEEDFGAKAKFVVVDFVPNAED